MKKFIITVVLLCVIAVVYIYMQKPREDQDDHASAAIEYVQPEEYPVVIKDYDSRGDDVKVIPDAYNTGCKLSQKMCPPEYFADDEKIISREDDHVLNLEKEIYSQEKIVFENLYVDDKRVFIANNNETYPEGTIEFINCYFGKGIKITTECKRKLIFRDCDFLEAWVTAVNSEFYSCKFYKSIGDGIQACFNVRLEDCYIYDNGYGDPEEYHADGIQIAGFGNAAAHDIYADNVRIEMPRCAPRFGQNAAIIIKMDYADGYDMKFQNMIINGGTYTLYIMPHNYELSNMQFENVKAGYSHQWENWLNAFNSQEADYGWRGAENVNCGYQERCYVSSVIKEEGGIAKLCITNETDGDRQVRVETDQGEYLLDIPRVLTYEEIEERSAVFEECNIDMLFEIPASKFVKVYDGEELIRYKVIG